MYGRDVAVCSSHGLDGEQVRVGAAMATSGPSSTSSCAPPTPDGPPAPSTISRPAAHPSAFPRRHVPCTKGGAGPRRHRPGEGKESLDELDDGLDESPLPGPDADEDEPDSPAPPYLGLGLYDAHEEALRW